MAFVLRVDRKGGLVDSSERQAIIRGDISPLWWRSLTLQELWVALHAAVDICRPAFKDMRGFLSKEEAVKRQGYTVSDWTGLPSGPHHLVLLQLTLTGLDPVKQVWLNRSGELRMVSLQKASTQRWLAVGEPLRIAHLAIRDPGMSQKPRDLVRGRVSLLITRMEGVVHDGEVEAQQLLKVRTQAQRQLEALYERMGGFVVVSSPG